MGSSLPVLSVSGSLYLSVNWELSCELSHLSAALFCPLALWWENCDQRETEGGGLHATQMGIQSHFTPDWAKDYETTRKLHPITCSYFPHQSSSTPIILFPSLPSSDCLLSADLCVDSVAFFWLNLDCHFTSLLCFRIHQFTAPHRF